MNETDHIIEYRYCPECRTYDQHVITDDDEICVNCFGEDVEDVD